MGGYLVVGNPTAQSGKAARVIERAVEGIERRGKEASALATEPEGKTVALVSEAVRRQRPDVVVYLGGDGTFNEVARGLMDADEGVPLGMLPMGTANNQGRSLGVSPGPGALDANLDIILRGHIVDLDAGRIEALDEEGASRAEMLFFDSVGWGMQPEILAKRNLDREEVSRIPILKELYRDQAVYAGATLDRFVASFVEPTKFDAEVISGGETHEYQGLTDLIISGTTTYAGAWVSDRFAEPDDGIFELVPMQGRRDWASKVVRDLSVLPVFQEDLDRLGIKHAAGHAAADFLLSFERPQRKAVATQVDGEEWLAGDRFRVTVIPNALPVITPEDFEPPWRFNREP